MDQKKLRELQLVQLSIVEDIHRVCISHSLRYYLVYGSALGAVRHKGFIPWDVDMDIAMPRDDYEAFIDIYSKELTHRLKCVSYKSQKKYFPPHALVVMKNTTISDRNGLLQTDLRPSGIYVDIFPLDVCPESIEDQKKQARKLAGLKLVKFRKASWILPGNGIGKILTKHIIRFLLSPFSWHYLNEKENRIMTKYNKNSHSGLICSMVGAYGYEKNTMPEEWYGEPKLTEFEHTKLFVPEHVHEILVKTYGDYTKYPSEEQQQAQRDLINDAKW